MIPCVFAILPGKEEEHYRYLLDTDGPRTNNYNEGYNNRINKLCGSGHPNLYKFINILKREESLASIKYFRAISGYEEDKRKKKDIERYFRWRKVRGF